MAIIYEICTKLTFWIEGDASEGLWGLENGKRSSSEEH